MNIFVLDERPWFAARYHTDRHCVKMILETAQLLCTAHHFLDGELAAKARIGEMVLRPTHESHPCAKWARENTANYEWLHSLGWCLVVEYQSRYSKRHAYAELYERLLVRPMNLPVSDKRTPFPLCMPPRYKRSDPVESYRRYYFGEKQHLAQWKYPAEKPTWWKDMERAQQRVAS